MMILLRRLVALAVLLLPLAVTAQSPSANSRPNVILIVADDLGYGDLGCYGQTRIKTPNLDKLAAEGVRFTDFYSGSTVCAPSRCALMTALHTGHCLIRGNDRVPLRMEDFTLAELLKRNGYYTGIIGKWGLGNENTSGAPENHGFEQVLAYLDQKHAHDYYTDRLWRYAPEAGFHDWAIYAENQGGKKGLYLPDVFTRAALNFIRINKPDQFNKLRPFFLYLAYTIPHANNEEGARSGNGMEVPNDAPYSDQPWPQPEKNKAAMITRMDADIGRILEALQKFRLEENTIVLFTSDNGPHKEGGVDPKFFQSSGGLRGLKRDLYEGGIRVPMIARWSTRIGPGRTSDLPAAFWDIMPTLAGLTGAKLTNQVDGISFAPTLLGTAQTNRHDFLYWEFHERGFQQAVRMGDWKAVRLKPGGSLELYNLKTDRAEKTDLASKEPAIVGKIEEYLKSARTESPNWPVQK
jgi:arylsulfatase A-like enzyme